MLSCKGGIHDNKREKQEHKNGREVRNNYYPVSTSNCKACYCDKHNHPKSINPNQVVFCFGLFIYFFLYLDKRISIPLRKPIQCDRLCYFDPVLTGRGGVICRLLSNGTSLLWSLLRLQSAQKIWSFDSFLCNKAFEQTYLHCNWCVTNSDDPRIRTSFYLYLWSMSPKNENPRVFTAAPLEHRVEKV